MRKLLLLLPLLFALALPTNAAAQNNPGAIVKTITTAGGSCSPATNCAVFGVKEIPSLGLYIDVGTSGTFNFEASLDSIIWFAINDDVGGTSTATADGVKFFTNSGYAYIRVRASAISGAATITGMHGYTGLKSTATLSGAAQGDGAIQDGASPAIEATVMDLANTNPIAVAITDASGNQITNLGGGTQYTNGSAQATPVGTGALGFDGANVRMLSTNASGNLQVVFASAQNVTNAGTFAVQAAQSGTWTVQPGNTANTTPWLTSISQGGNTASVNASGQLSITCANCSGSGASSVDNSAFTFGTTSGAGAYFVFDDTSPNAATEDRIAAGRISSNRNQYFQLRDGLNNERGASVTAANALKVDGSAVTQPVSGTVAATQSGTWTVQPGNTVNTTPWLTSISQGGNTASVNASSQLLVNCANCSGSGVSHQDNLAFTFGTTSMVPIGGVLDDTSSNTATENSASVARITSNKALHVNLRSGTNEVGTSGAPLRVDPTGTTSQPVTGSYTPADNDSPTTTIKVAAYNMCYDGATWDRCQPDPAHDAADSGAPLKIGGKAVNAVPTAVTNNDRVDGLFNTVGAMGQFPVANSYGGATPTGVTSAASTNSTSVTAAASTLYGVYLVNTTATVYYIRFYDSASAPTCSSATNYKFSLPIPSNSTSGGGFSMPFPTGLSFANGIGYCITGGGGSTDNTNAATGIFGVISSK